MGCSQSILIVDDDEDIREALRDTLEDEGHPAVAVGDGPSALHWLKQGAAPPCLILLDWNMAPMNGAQVLEAIRADPALAALPVVLVTADVRIEEKSRAAGLNGALKKPVDLETLFQVIRRHCGAQAT